MDTFDEWLCSDQKPIEEKKLDLDYKAIISKFFAWFFDKKKTTEIPIEVLHYKSPVTQQFILNMLMRYPDLIIYINEHFNKLGTYQLDKKEFYSYVKILAQKHKVVEKNISWISAVRPKDPFFSALIKKAPYLKKTDIDLIAKKLSKPEYANAKLILESTLGLTKKPVKEKLTKEDKEKIMTEQKEEISVIKNVCKALEGAIKKKPRCQECPLLNQDYTLIDGNAKDFKSCDIVFLGEAPGAEEVIVKKPFIGKAGQLLRTFITDHELDKFNYVITNILVCADQKEMQNLLKNQWIVALIFLIEF